MAGFAAIPDSASHAVQGSSSDVKDQCVAFLAAMGSCAGRCHQLYEAGAGRSSFPLGAGRAPAELLPDHDDDEEDILSLVVAIITPIVTHQQGELM